MLKTVYGSFTVCEAAAGKVYQFYIVYMDSQEILVKNSKIVIGH